MPAYVLLAVSISTHRPGAYRIVWRGGKHQGEVVPFASPENFRYTHWDDIATSWPPTTFSVSIGDGCAPAPSPTPNDGSAVGELQVQGLDPDYRGLGQCGFK